MPSLRMVLGTRTFQYGVSEQGPGFTGSGAVAFRALRTHATPFHANREPPIRGGRYGPLAQQPDIGRTTLPKERVSG